MGRRGRSVSSSDKDFGIVIVNNFIDDKTCLKITKAFDVLNEEPDIYGTKDTDMVKVVVNPKIEIMQSVLLNVLEKTQEFYSQQLYISEFRISCYKPGYSMGLHDDSVSHKEPFTASAVLYLNNDFSGGDIFFPYRELKHTPAMCDLVVFDSKNKKNLHGVETTTSGIRYSSAIWMTDKKNEALSFIHN
jgi:predicted 2-oxoglutarate/Fe(II)-dependent dioxygenase YbiX